MKRRTGNALALLNFPSAAGGLQGELVQFNAGSGFPILLKQLG
jgi:hypothetical protein